MASRPLVRIGTRASRLALVQTYEVRDRLIAAHPELAAEGAIEIVDIRTTGDRITDRALAEIGGKGLFTREIDEAMLDRRIDIAVHSMKDVPTWLPDGIDLPCVLPREDPRFVFICPSAGSLDALPAGAVVGTASLRRQAQVLVRRPDLRVVVFRGNVETRMRKLAAGEVDATLLALAGLKRLGMADAATAVLEPEVMLPAVGQGAIGITCRAGDDDSLQLLEALNDPATAACVAAERGFLEVLDGSCRTPIAALATIEGGATLAFRGLVAREDGSRVVDVTRAGAADEAAELGREAGRELRARAGAGFIEAWE